MFQNSSIIMPNNLTSMLFALRNKNYLRKMTNVILWDNF